MRTVLAIGAALILLAACGDDDDGKTDAKGARKPVFHTRGSWPTPQERRMREDHEPTPYTALQIRDGCPSGRRVTFRLQYTSNVPMQQEWTYQGADEQGVTIFKAFYGTDGEPGEPKERRFTWADIQNNGSKPADLTVVTEERIEVPAGTFDCMLYTVTRTAKGKTGLDRFWYAWKLPGPPVKYEQHIDGKLALTMTMLRNEMPGVPR